MTIQTERELYEVGKLEAKRRWDAEQPMDNPYLDGNPEWRGFEDETRELIESQPKASEFC